jgi:hypothetical protein
MKKNKIQTEQNEALGHGGSVEALNYMEIFGLFFFAKIE